MFKPSRWHRGIKEVNVVVDVDHEEEVRTNLTYAKGIIKYIDLSDCTPELVESVLSAVHRLVELEITTTNEFCDWINLANPGWLPAFGSTPASRRRRNADRLIGLVNHYRERGLADMLQAVAIRCFRRLGGSMRRQWGAVKSRVMRH